MDVISEPLSDSRHSMIDCYNEQDKGSVMD